MSKTITAEELRKLHMEVAAARTDIRTVMAAITAGATAAAEGAGAEISEAEIREREERAAAETRAEAERKEREAGKRAAAEAEATTETAARKVRAARAARAAARDAAMAERLRDAETSAAASALKLEALQKQSAEKYVPHIVTIEGFGHTTKKRGVAATAEAAPTQKDFNRERILKALRKAHDGGDLTTGDKSMLELIGIRHDEAQKEAGIFAARLEKNYSGILRGAYSHDTVDKALLETREVLEYLRSAPPSRSPATPHGAGIDGAKQSKTCVIS